MKNVGRGIGALALGFGVMGAGCWTWSCFVRGTRIITPQGFRPIEDLRVGDEVYSLDVATRRPVVRRVGALLRAEATEILHIAAGELVLRGVTAEHPFYDAEQGTWTPAGEIHEGTRILAWLGAADVRELGITTHRTAGAIGKVEVFNLTIDGPEHNYFAEGFLVHNKDPPGYGGTGEGTPCFATTDCTPYGLTCATIPDDGTCGEIARECTAAGCEEGPLRTICGCDGKPHITDSCPSFNDIQVDTRPGACAPPEGMMNCGSGTCAVDTQFCVEGFTSIQCVDLPPSCTGPDATCDCFMAAGISTCGCNTDDVGFRVRACAP